MLKQLIAAAALAASTGALAAAPVYYQAKTIVALLSDKAVVRTLPGGYIIDVKYRSDLGPYSYEIISQDYPSAKLCTTPVVMKIASGDGWDPTYMVESIGTTSCL